MHRDALRAGSDGPHGAAAPAPGSGCPVSVPSASLPARRRVKVAVVLLTQQANTPKSVSCVRLSCSTLARSRSEAFWPNLGGDGVAVGRAMPRSASTGAGTDVCRAPHQVLSWLLPLPSHCPSLLQAGTGSQGSAPAQRTVQFSVTRVPSASSSVSLVAGTRNSGDTLQRSGGTAGRGVGWGS